jgi:GNAT superfamily N-acetyltransferase
VELVTLNSGYLPDLMRLKASAGWNQTEDDWLRCMRLQPDGCLGLVTDGVVVSSATTIRYGDDISWIGMVLTLPEYRGQGLARRLMQVVIERSRTRRVGLDASDMGKPLYLSLGFVEECPIERWVREPAPAEGPELPRGHLDLSLDREVFGADRSALLDELSRYEVAQSNRSYAFARTGSSFDYFGPWISDTPDDASALLSWFLGRHGARTTCIDLFPHHTHAAQLAHSFGFTPVRRLTRMVLRPAVPEVPDTRIYGIAGFEFG